MKSGPAARVVGRYLVVPVGTVFPRQCVRTGKYDALQEIDETVATPAAIAKAMGPMRYFCAHEEVHLRYYISHDSMRRLALWHRAWLWFTLAAMVALVAACVFRQIEAAAIALTFLSGSIGAYIVRPLPLNVAAVHGGEVFLLGIPKEIIAAMTGSERPR